MPELVPSPVLESRSIMGVKSARFPISRKSGETWGTPFCLAHFAFVGRDIYQEFCLRSSVMWAT
jgi:hypothetical protein